MRALVLLVLSAGCADSPALRPELTPTSVIGTWSIDTAYNRLHHKSSVQNVMWIELSKDGTALAATCAAPEHATDSIVACRTQPVCSTGHWTMNDHDLSLVLGPQTFSGRVEYIVDGWSWSSDVLGAEVTGVLLHTSTQRPESCR